MGRGRWDLMLAMSVACGLIAGCGSASSQSPAAHLSVIAPVDGATVNVGKIEVFGDVEPKNAVVRVAGRRIHAVNGVFKRPMSLRRGVTRIRIVAVANGYATARAEVEVRYQPAPTIQNPAVPAPAASGLQAAGQTSGASAGSPANPAAGNAISEGQFVSGCLATGG